MGLTLKMPISTKQGMLIESGYYIRLTAKLQSNGHTLEIELNEYPNAGAFDGGLEPLPNSLPKFVYMEYDRARDGGDILAVAHAYTFEMLKGLGFDSENIQIDTL